MGSTASAALKFPKESKGDLWGLAPSKSDAIMCQLITKVTRKHQSATLWHQWHFCIFLLVSCSMNGVGVVRVHSRYTPKQLFGGLHCLLTCVNITLGRRVNSSELPNQRIDWAEPKILMIVLHLIWLNKISIIWSFPICHLSISEHLISTISECSNSPFWMREHQHKKYTHKIFCTPPDLNQWPPNHCVNRHKQSLLSNCHTIKSSLARLSHTWIWTPCSLVWGESGEVLGRWWEMVTGTVQQWCRFLITISKYMCRFLR